MQLLPRSTRSLGRTSAAFVGAAVIGLLSVGVLASPASAHSAALTADTGCNNGKHVVTWTVSNDFPSAAHLEGIVSSPAGVNLGDRIGARPQGRESTSITATQEIDGDVMTAELKIGRVTWDDSAHQDNLRKVIDLHTPCKPEPSATAKPPKCVNLEQALYRHTFDGATGVATVTLDGPKPLCEGLKQPFFLVSYTPPKSPTGAENKFDSDAKSITSDKDGRTISLHVKLPVCGTKLYLVWGEKQFDKVDPKGVGYGDRILGSKGKPGSRSAGPYGVYAGKPGDACVDKPAVTFSSTCKGIDITLTNAGRVPALFIGESKVGTGQYTTFEKGVTVAPGKSVSMFVKGVRGLMVRITSGASINSEYSWSPPESCAPPTPAPTVPPVAQPAQPGLPVTGADAAIMATSALGLVGGGAVLMVLARRRRLAIPANGVDDSTTTLPDDLA